MSSQVHLSADSFDIMSAASLPSSRALNQDQHLAVPEFQDVFYNNVNELRRTVPLLRVKYSIATEDAKSITQKPCKPMRRLI